MPSGVVFSFVCDIGDTMDFDCSGKCDAEKRNDVMLRHTLLDILGS